VGGEFGAEAVWGGRLTASAGRHTNDIRAAPAAARQQAGGAYGAGGAGRVAVARRVGARVGPTPAKASVGRA
jgi:hypothetical protein